jgi:hypothetical protein
MLINLIIGLGEIKKSGLVIPVGSFILTSFFRIKGLQSV